MPVICAADIAYPYNAAVADSSSGSGSVAPETPIDYVPDDVAATFAPGHAKRPKTSTTRAREDSPERTSDAKKAAWESSGDAFASSHAAPSAQEEDRTMAQC